MSAALASTVDPERLLKELRTLWRDLGKDDPNGVLRACAMTLIVVVDEASDAAILGETIASLMHDHPSRAIVIRVRQCPEQVLEARVFAQCWMPFGRRQQICCEQVEFIASASALADVASVVRGLVVPDLPSILYVPSENLWVLPTFGALLPLAEKIIVDSCGLHESGKILDFLSDLPTHVERRADLVWSRLTPWRQAIARIFEDASRARRIQGINSVEIHFSGKEQPAAVWYLGGWFRHVLGGEVAVKMSHKDGPEYASIAHVALSGRDLEATVEITSRNTAETRVNGESLEVTVFPVANDEYALRQELAFSGRDPLFRDVLLLARRMRGSH